MILIDSFKLFSTNFPNRRVVEHDVDKKLEANLLHILRCVRTTLRPFRREVLPDSIDEMTQQQKIVYYFLRSGNGLGVETSYSEMPIPKREMSAMEHTDLSERSVANVSEAPLSRTPSFFIVATFYDLNF